ncbi:hypothetical protein ZWY2020_033956 [Hordeum vulgare]|nr:hypothetical protein ZWY2020_033956 [Hordeum vulgare]
MAASRGEAWRRGRRTRALARCQRRAPIPLLFAPLSLRSAVPMLSPPSPNLDKIDMIHRISGDTRLQLLVGHAGSTDELLFNVNPTDLLSLAEFATITAFGEDEHWGADNADDHPTTNEPAQAEIQEEEEEEDETTPDVQQQMPPPKEPSHDASTEASCAVSPRKNYRSVAGRGPSPRCVKQNIGVEQELESKGSSPKRAATTVEAPNPAKNTRSKAMQAPNPAKNTRSKKLMF